MKTPDEVYAEIRAKFPDKPWGRHWDNLGYYVGDGVWCDPEEVGMESEGDYELAYEAQSNVPSLLQVLKNIIG